MWCVCDRCSFEYKRREMRKETTGWLVCHSCYDGAYDLKNHPQNRPARPRREPTPVPDGTGPIDITDFLLREDSILLLTEDGQTIEVTYVIWPAT